MRSCEVLVNKIKAGILEENDKREFIFTYDKEYLERPDAKPVSLTLPIRKEPYFSQYLFPTFANMLSEGENREIQSQLLHVDPEDDFGIMLETCLYDTIGAVTIKPIKK